MTTPLTNIKIIISIIFNSNDHNSGILGFEVNMIQK